MTSLSRNPRKNPVLGKVYWRATDAQQVLDLWRRSGMTLSEFARRHGLDRNRLARWRDRLREESAVRFHPVQVVERRRQSVAPDILDGQDGCGIDIVLLSGRRLMVRRGFDADLLAQVIGVLEGESRC